MTRNRNFWIVVVIILIGVAPVGMAHLTTMGAGAGLGWFGSLGTFVNHLGK